MIRWGLRRGGEVGFRGDIRWVAVRTQAWFRGAGR